MATINTDLCVNVAGPVAIFTGTGTSRALEHLGWSIDGFEIEQQTFVEGVPGDENGGTSGPPIDYQKFGNQHRIILNLNKFDVNVMAKVELAANPAANVEAVVGMLLNCTGQHYRLLLQSANFIRNYPYCHVIEPVRGNYGSRFTAKQVVLVAQQIGGLLYNQDVTG